MTGAERPLDAVAQLHARYMDTLLAYPDEHGGWVEVVEGSAEQIISTEERCVECRKLWPCPTVVLIQAQVPRPGVPQSPPVAVVTWEDTTNVATWQDADDIREFATDGGWVCQNVGWVVHEDDDCIVLAARRADDKQGHVGLAERIPKRAIISRTLTGGCEDHPEEAEGA